jgi:glycerol-3-phosphate dehydrogenase (NAD(P)+)
LTEKEHKVKLWVLEKDLAVQIQETRENKQFLPGFSLPAAVEITADLKSLNDGGYYFFAVPTQFLRSVAQQLKGIIPPEAVAISAGKGLELNSLKVPLEVIKEELPLKKLAVLSGPNLSAEIVQGLPAATVVAAQDPAIAKLIQSVLMLDRFRVYTNDDPLGVQLGGALKNIIAIAAGITDGLGLGNNAKAGIMIRGLSEITRLGVAMGAQAKTFAGLSGMGDLITTCSSQLSRNHFVGEQIAKGKKLNDLLAGMKEVAEGVPTTKAALALGDKHHVSLPITREVYQVLYEGKKPYQAIADLMTRSAKDE